MESNELFLVGDTHSITVFRGLIEQIPKNGAVLHIGDCGIGFDKKRDKKRLAILNSEVEDKNLMVYILRGNHDDPSFWAEDGWYGRNLILIPDYSKMVFPNGKRALLIGGGVSLDRVDRVPDVSWWKDETTPYLPEYCQNVEYMFIHDAPSYFNKPGSTVYQDFRYYCDKDENLVKDSEKQRDVIDKIVALCKPSKIFGGHFHNSTFENVNDIQYRCLSENEIYQFNA